MFRSIASVFSLLILVSFVACLSEQSKVDPWKTDSKGIQFQIVEDSLGEMTTKVGDKIAFDLQILFRGDSLIYNSKKRGHALEFIFTDKMFNGSFAEVVPKLTVGDSCVLRMLTEQFYPDGMPRGVQKGDTIVCGMRLLEVEPR